MDPERWDYGNANDHKEANWGWFVGRFLDARQFGIRHTTNVEVKWYEHKKGDVRERTTREDSTTLTVLAHGRFLVSLYQGDEPLASRELARAGDFLIWGPGILHEWAALDDATMVTVRWPSLGRGRSARADAGRRSRAAPHPFDH